MIIFHEGLPRSGKSYEAVVSRILPALRSGRKVFAYIEGLNHQKFADILEKPLDEIQRLLIFVPKDHVKDIYDHVENDALVVIDELQDFFPTSREPLNEKQTTFVTQHGHRGLDIIVMGQDHRDCHMLWKRRIDQLITFVKRDAIGLPNQYTWTTHKQKAGKFEKLLSGSGSYDPKYFGLYQSHEASTLNKATYTDDRANVFKSKAFTLYLPLFLAAVCFSVYYLYRFFTGDVQFTKEQTKPLQALEQSQNTGNKAAKPETQPPAKPEPPPAPRQPDNYLEKILGKYRPRLVGLVESKEKNRMVAWIEFVDENNRVYDRLNIPAIVGFGFFVERKPYGLLLNNGKQQYPVTPFPIERSERVTRRPHDTIAQNSGGQ